MRHHKPSAKQRMFRGPTLPNDLTDLLREKLRALRPSVKADYLNNQVFSKFVSKDTDPPLTRKIRAENKWLAAERDNEATEDRLLTTPHDHKLWVGGATYSQFVEFCSNVIGDLIGDVPPVDALVGAFSGGASTSRPRTHSFPAGKYVGKAHVTSDCLDGYFGLLPEELPSWFGFQNSDRLTPVKVQGNVMFTVPKKTDIDRVAAKEPDLNMFVQKGIGDFFRSRLLRAKINLNDQSINRSLALRGSIDGSLATLDLSSASDSVTTELVFQLLPVTWFTLLDAVRCRVTTLVSGEEHRNCMFSSMGNGFTFELESLLFYALMRTTAYFTGTRGVVSVYGDDLIIPTRMADEAIQVLNYFGFQVNTEKSFVDGPFRESCGGHFWNGVDITPFYVKKPIESIPDLIHVANQLRKWGDLKIGSERFSSVIDDEVEEIWLWLKSLVPNILWGGVDFDFKYQLVSHDTPHSRLKEMTKQVRAGNSGGYLHWLNATWHRTEYKEHVVTSRFNEPRDAYELRSVRDKTVPRLEALFIHELESYMP